jgi:hypothetical protein
MKNKNFTITKETKRHKQSREYDDFEHYQTDNTETIITQEAIRNLLRPLALPLWLVAIPSVLYLIILIVEKLKSF